MERANVWVGGGAVLNVSLLSIEGQIDAFVTVPSPARVRESKRIVLKHNTSVIQYGNYFALFYFKFAEDVF